MPTSESISDLLQRTRVVVAPGEFFVLAIRDEDWARLLENPELSPSGEAPYLFFRDDREVTLVLEQSDWRRIRHAARDAKVEGGFRLVTFDIELDWNVIGFLAHITSLLAARNISVAVLTSFSRDHLLIRQDDLASALRILGEHVKELC